MKSMKKSIEQIKEHNKSLIALRNNYFTMIIVVSSGVVGLLLGNVQLAKMLLLIMPGVYLDVIFILKFQNTIDKIDRNIEEMQK